MDYKSLHALALTISLAQLVPAFSLSPRTLSTTAF